ncbi:hypothetical protein [Burkholderia multivorans]|uniref:hypothetical protein n=1 Tax=Burkholderia multivorans TaxID=87883 RepID=UPI00123C64B1|nr:hypothetical protein [Burkholderia multivorans]MCO7333475.1 hypothetical protein [Burkholderia multivorans]MCO7342975.1 hypothetical protein [Burkholderia multivorans]MCO7345954.1 hypothetical protein [Burkholderia multivorans]QET30055.1 hypothetical protein FOB31_09620 [Burkholderia multivorans]QET39372.1 hypothetical protein FOB30_16750 [Burkholderia multivorans]
MLGNLLKAYAGMHFHQVITGDTTTTVVNERRERLMVNDPVLHTTEVPLPDVNAAIAYQQKQIGRELGQYDERSNSCVDHVANVLRAGDENVPSGPLGQSLIYEELEYAGYGVTDDRAVLQRHGGNWESAEMCRFTDEHAMEQAIGLFTAACAKCLAEML